MKNDVKTDRNAPDQNAHLVALLMEQNELQKHENELLKSNHSALEKKYEDVVEQLAWFKRQLFGQKSERYTPVTKPGDVDDLFGFAAPDSEPETQYIPAHSRKKKKKGESSTITFDDSVPVIEEILDVPESERVCPETGEPLEEFDRDICDTLVITPPKVHIKRTIRPKYIKPGKPAENKPSKMIQAKAEPSLFRGSKLDPSFYAYAVSQKYAFHLPLNRLLEQLRLCGVHMSSQLLSSAVINSAGKLKKVAELMEKRLFEQKYLFTDDTGGKALRMGPKGKAKKVYLWGYIGGEPGKPKYILYKYSKGRGHDVPREHLSGFCGTITADAFGSYEKMHNDKELNIRWNGCYCHARRNFEPYAEICELSAFAMEVMQEIFMNEREALLTCPAGRLAIRQEVQKPLVEGMFEEFERALREDTLRGKVKTAIAYMLSRKDVFTAFLEDPNLRIENNTAEHAMRKWKLGHNNWMFFGSENGLEAGCILMSLTQTCRAMNIDPFEYFHDLFVKLATTADDDLVQFLPDVWLKNRQALAAK